jgi:3'-phosphoadenosine 5'-phosphosulfate sulfotransferase (PAPS reductase)/FAD synthetase
MSQNLSLESHKSGLESDYEKRRVNSFELGKKAIDALLAEGKEVTLHNVSKKTKELDEQGIHFNTIRNHEELYAYYKDKSKSYKKKQKELEKHLPYRENEKHTFQEFEQLNPNRNLKNVYRQYMRLTKAELATRLIEAEQYIAKGNQEYLKKLFEEYEG